MPGASQDPNERKIVASLIEARDAFEAMIAEMTAFQAKRRLRVDEDRILRDASKALLKLKYEMLPDALAQNLSSRKAAEIMIWLHHQNYKLPIKEYINRKK